MNPLFGNPTQGNTQQPSTNLFGAKPTTGGLFGAPTTTTTNTQPLMFGNQPLGMGAGVQNLANQPNPLFGGNQQNKPLGFLGAPAQAGLMGQQTTNTLQPTPMFGQNTGGQAQNILGQQPQLQNPMGNQGQNILGQPNFGAGNNPAATQGLFNPPKTGNQPTTNLLGGNIMPNQGNAQLGVDPNKNLQGDQQKSQLTFGVEIHKKGSPSKDSQAIMAQAISQHMTIEDLYKKWKKELEEQVNDFLKLGRDLNKDEKDLYEMFNMLVSLNSNLKQLENDYTHIETSLGGLERQQDELITRLNHIEGELTKTLPQDNEQSHIKSSANLLNKAKDLNKETILIESQIQKLVDEVNQPLKEYNEDANKILNSYYEALEYIELDTLAIQNKLNSFEIIVEKQGLK